MNQKSYTKILILIILLGSTVLLYFFLSGWRPNINFTSKVQLSDLKVKQTGMISAKSQPEGANVYLDDKLITATNNSISGVDLGKHKLKIVKNGYVTWEKEIEVFPELVTDITAMLISQTPRLEPLTNTGARKPTLSYSLEKLAFFSKDPEASGVWIVSFKDQGLNFFANSAKNAVKDTNFVKYSDGKNITWSPDEDELLIETNESKFYLVNLTSNNVSPITNPNETKDIWNKKIQKKRLDFISKIEIPEDRVKIASDENTIWSPDNKKFIYKKVENNKIKYLIYNMETPIPVGEKIETVVLELDEKQPQPKITWYSDSFHIILVENFDEKNHKGKISIVRIDGTNKVEIYSNTLYSNDVYTTIYGDKLVILTTFKSGDQTDLYTLGIR
ncbi:MAG: PEGA domain-containing protein [Proteobacteria bacterium]|nr:PEGA domain-containing protein [Pseudomonadota bacterium]